LHLVIAVHTQKCKNALPIKQAHRDDLSAPYYAYPQEGDYHLSFRWQVQLDIDNQLFLHVIKFYTHKQNDSIHENIHFETQISNTEKTF